MFRSDDLACLDVTIFLIGHLALRDFTSLIVGWSWMQIRWSPTDPP